MTPRSVGKSSPPWHPVGEGSHRTERTFRRCYTDIDKTRDAALRGRPSLPPSLRLTGAVRDASASCRRPTPPPLAPPPSPRQPRRAAPEVRREPPVLRYRSPGRPGYRRGRLPAPQSSAPRLHSPSSAAWPSSAGWPTAPASRGTPWGGDALTSAPRCPWAAAARTAQTASASRTCRREGRCLFTADIEDVRARLDDPT